jgi:hypothetical protein
MKRVMMWMWEHHEEELDAKGKVIKKTVLLPEENPATKKLRVALYRETR